MPDDDVYKLALVRFFAKTMLLRRVCGESFAGVRVLNRYVVLAAALSVVLFSFSKAMPPVSAEEAEAAQKQGSKSNDDPTAVHEVETNPKNIVGHGQAIRAIAISADGLHALTGSSDYSMMHWQLWGVPPKDIGRFDEHDAGVNAVEFVPGKNRAISAGDDGSIWLWDLKTKKLIHRFKGHTAKVVDIAISPDGRFAASASWDGTVRLWDLDKLKAGKILKGHKSGVNAAIFVTVQKRSLLYSAGKDGIIIRWNTEKGDVERYLYKHGWGINVLKALQLNGSNRLLIGSVNGDLGVVDLESGDLIEKLKPHDGPVLSLAVTPDQKLFASGGSDGFIRVWFTEDWKLGEEHFNPYNPIWALGFVLEGNGLYYGGLDEFATFWQVKPRKLFEPIVGEYPRKYQAKKAGSPGELHFLRKCSFCHTLTPDSGNKSGPTLYKLFGRKAGTVKGFPYSDAVKNSGIVWNEKTITALFEEGPEVYTPGTKMPLQRITDKNLIQSIVAYLKKATNGTSE